MKRVILLFIGLFFAFSFTSNKRKFIPPGTRQISDTLFADESEISNFAWKEFEIWTRNKYGLYSPQHLAVLPDTLVWKNETMYNEPFVSLYYWHPAFRDYPVVGISYEQAVQYCIWRTERVKEFLNIAHKTVDFDFYYRLPSKAEWESFTYNGRFELSNKGRDNKGYCKINALYGDDSHLTMVDDKGVVAEVTAPVFSFKKNIFGLYNVFGNVSEMVNEKGICKGGSWRDHIGEILPGRDYAYTGPSDCVGFRCVCIIKKANPVGFASLHKQ